MIFVDTSFWYALTHRADPRYRQAVALFRSWGAEPLVTSNHVRGETWTLTNHREGWRGARRVLDLLDASQRLEVVHVSEPLEADALEWLRRHDEREYSFVDATSFALMRNMGIESALAFDGDFAAAGFVELR